MPDLPTHHADQWRAFQEIQASRESGWDGVTPISHRELESWFNNNAIQTDEREEFTAVIFALDRVWREAVAKRRAKRTAPEDAD